MGEAWAAELKRRIIKTSMEEVSGFPVDLAVVSLFYYWIEFEGG